MQATTDGKPWDVVQSIVIRWMLVHGDIGVLLTRDFQNKPSLQVVPGHRIGSFNGKEAKGNRIQGGVEFEEKGGRIMRYWIQERGQKNPTAVKPQDFLLIYRDEYPAGYRGFSPLASAVIDALDESEILDLMKLTLRYQASIPAVYMTSEGDVEEGYEGGVWSGVPGAAQSGKTIKSASLLPPDTRVETVRGITVPYIKQEDRIEDFGSKRPNQTFQPFLEFITGRICVSMGMPYELLMRNNDMGTGAGTRSIIRHAEDTFKAWSKVMIRKLCLPVYQYILRRGIMRGDIPYSDDWFAVRFQSPSLPSVDVGRDSKSMLSEIASGVKTREEIHLTEGRTFEEVQVQREKEERAIWQSAHRIAAEFGLDPVAVRNSMANTGIVEDEKKPVASGQET